jgi:hypothetical protein
MFWRRNKSSTAKPATVSRSFEEAKEATRRAAFLNVAQGMTTDEAYKQGLAELLRTCRSEALAAGAAEGRTDAEVDAAIADLCDADVARMQRASDDEFRDFAQESGRIVNEFLARE